MLLLADGSKCLDLSLLVAIGGKRFVSLVDVLDHDSLLAHLGRRDVGDGGIAFKPLIVEVVDAFVAYGAA